MLWWVSALQHSVPLGETKALWWALAGILRYLTRERPLLEFTCCCWVSMGTYVFLYYHSYQRVLSKTLLILPLGWLSWFGNSIVIFVLYRQRSTLQPTDYLTFNLAVSDASISVFGYSRGIIEIFNVFKDSGYLISSIWTCQVFHLSLTHLRLN